MSSNSEIQAQMQKLGEEQETVIVVLGSGKAIEAYVMFSGEKQITFTSAFDSEVFQVAMGEIALVTVDDYYHEFLGKDYPTVHVRVQNAPDDWREVAQWL